MWAETSVARLCEILPELKNVTCLGLLAMLAGKSWNVWNGGRWCFCSYLAARSTRSPTCQRCLSVSLFFFFFLVVVFELLFFFRVQIKQRWLKANEIFFLFKKKRRKKAHLHFITYMKRSIVRRAAHEMCFSPLCNAALGLLCFIKLKLMFVECHWNHSLRKD